MIGIYKITNIMNGKVYIGKSVDINKRIVRHRCNGSKIRDYVPESHLYRAMHKYGIENFTFEVLEKCSESELNEREMYYIHKYNSTNEKFGYNKSIGGEGGTKISRCKVVDLWNEDMTISSIARECDCGRNTVKEILAECGVDYKSEASRRWVRQKSRKVSQYTIDGHLVKIWESAREIERELGFDHAGIGCCCKNLYRQYGGFKWRYADEDEIDTTAD